MATTKEDTAYEISEENGKFQAELTISGLAGIAETIEFKGKPADNKKTAQANAARKALGVLSKQIKEAKKAHEEKQKQKRAEREARLKQKKEEAKAAEAAA